MANGCIYREVPRVIYINKTNLIPNSVYSTYEASNGIVFLGTCEKEDSKGAKGKYLVYISVDVLSEYPPSRTLEEIFKEEMASSKKRISISKSPKRNLMFKVGELDREVLKGQILEYNFI